VSAPGTNPAPGTKPVLPVSEPVQGPGLAAGDGGSIPAATLQAIKDATVFIKTKAGAFEATGSGFLMMAEGKIGYVVTNNHVIAPPDELGRQLPAEPALGQRVNYLPPTRIRPVGPRVPVG